MTTPITLPGDLPGLNTQRDEWLGSNGEPLAGDLVLSVCGRLVGSGMDIAARWLAEKVGLQTEATAPRFVRTNDGTGWCIGTGPGVVYFLSAEPDWWPSGLPYRIVPGISAITDPAEALRLVCLAVAGRSA